MLHKGSLYLSIALAGSLVLSSCSKLGDLSADNFTVTPSPLEAVSGQVPVTINGRFPEKYMKKKAVVTVIPVLRYQGGEAKGQPATFQGERVLGNNQEISYKVGGNYTMRNTFTYQPAMQQSELYLTFDARVGNKTVKVNPVKVANGVIATSMLVGRTAASSNMALGEDAYQYAIAQTQQAQIRYLINQANIRTSELKSVSVQDFLGTLRQIKNDQKGYQLDNLEISAYASPEGSLQFNTQLAEKRQNSSEGYVRGELKKVNMDADINTRYTAEDWEGFQELVQASNIQDKDVILRVLSMYSDPEEREQQIRNLSAGFKELADEILPELRRARLTINYNIIGRSDDEIQAQYKADASQLSIEEVLYAATLTDNAAEKKDIYTTATRLYPNDYRAYNNLATLAIAEGNLTATEKYLSQAAEKNANAPEINANRALLALAKGNISQVETYAARATTAKNYNEVIGNLNIFTGNYAQAAQSLNGCKTNQDATTSYLKAIVAARTNNNSAVLSNLRDAFAKDASFKAMAAKDLEFAALFGDAAFQNLVR